MSSFWHWFIVIITLGMIAATVWLILWAGRMRVPKNSDNTTGHVWDEDLTELNNPLPRWWLWMFWATIIFSLIYMVLYPGLGRYEGVLGWTQEGQYEQEVEVAMETFEARFAELAELPLDELATDEQALRIGRNLYAHHCSTCHGTDARGFTGYPNLTDNVWQWGGSPQAILHSIQQGRQAAMPGWQNALGEVGVTEVVVYMQQINNQRADAAMASRGERHYQQLCAACHGPEANGNPALGAPALNDGVWLYGGSYEALRKSVAEGRHGNMPAHLPILGEARSRLVAAYVLSLSAETNGQSDD